MILPTQDDKLAAAVLLRVARVEHEIRNHQGIDRDAQLFRAAAQIAAGYVAASTGAVPPAGRANIATHSLEIAAMIRGAIMQQSLNGGQAQLIGDES